ncbi:hypothetical protein E0H80_01585 [Acinetobacter sp. ANC 4779]|uniref:hypothetical protein n=1 Tax=Acinetobacter sp. ANC 4779 TaxID=2529848 RepID=UPI00103B4321|nr:hypothetical protein [Acinetobacter sp. ANC 4779]TCB52565.1 hypothetical protein E0H80_01585 [Acinetobacter sp. ANC 4779]
MDILLGKVGKSIKKVLYQQEISVFAEYRNLDLQHALSYSPNSSLEEDQWFFLDSLLSKNIKNPITDCLNANSNDWVQISSDEYTSIRFLSLIDKVNGRTFYQKVPNSMLIKKPRLNWTGLNDQPNISVDPIILINEIPDAIYDESVEKLYFRDISKLTDIFRGIDQQFKEATEVEVSNFVNSTIFNTATGFDIKKVSTPVRKKINAVQTRFNSFSAIEQAQFINNVQQYLSHINFQNGKFIINKNEDVRDLADALDQRFHETPITREKRRTQSYRSL